MKTGMANSREIERKYLVKRLPEKLKQSRRYVIAQGYLAKEPAGRQVRLRKKGKTASLTFKVGRGRSRPFGRRPQVGDCTSCVMKFRGEI